MSSREKRQRVLMMIFGAFAIFFTGFPHIWSIYQPYVMELAGWTQGQSSLCFYLALASFVFGNIVGGRIQDRKNPRIVIFIGGAIFTTGIILSAFLIIPSPIPIYLTYGIMQGFGQGMIYTTIISTAQKWFPGHTGFASGIVVTANGLCGFFLAPLSRVLLEKTGPSGALFTIGIGIGISWILSSLFFFVPDEKWRKKEEKKMVSQSEEDDVLPKQYTSNEMMKTKQFYLLMATMMFGLISYFMLSPVSQTYQVGKGIPETIAVTAVMAGSVANAATRLLLPTLADKIGRIGCIKAVLLVSIAAMLVLVFGSSYLVMIAIVMMYGCYGGIMGSFPSFTSSIFGMKYSGENYGYVMFGIVIATVAAPALTGIMTGKGMTMETVFVTGAAFSLVALISIKLLEKELNRTKVAKKERENGISNNESFAG